MKTEQLTQNQFKAKVRLTMITELTAILQSFFELKYMSRRDVYLQLCIQFPKYNSIAYYKKFGLMWNYVAYDKKMITDLKSTIEILKSSQND